MRRALLASFALAALAAPAAAFDSLPFTGGTHGAITREALEGLPEGAIAKVVEGNWRSDYEEMTLGLSFDRALFVPNDRYDPGHHFDRWPGDTHAAAFSRGAAFVQAMRREAGAHLANGDPDQALLAMGRALHALQDLCSHSNVSALSPTDRATAEAILRGIPLAPPRALTLTGYDPETGRDPEGDAFGHDACSYDQAHRDPAGHARAREAAVALSRSFAALVRKDAGEVGWRRLEAY